MMDSAPIVCITGNVAQGLMGTDAFQEIDILGVTLPIVKHSILVRDAADVPAAVEEAFHIAASGRPGPVVIDLPKDVLMKKHDYVAPKKPVEHKSYKPQTKPDPKKIEQAIELIAKANEELTEALLKKLRSAGILDIDVLFTNELDQGAYISQTLRTD